MPSDEQSHVVAPPRSKARWGRRYAVESAISKAKDRSRSRRTSSEYQRVDREPERPPQDDSK